MITWISTRNEILSNPQVKEHFDKMEPELDIARKLFMLRIELGLTQRELANKAGIKQPQLARLETAKQLARLDTLQQIANSVNYSFEVKFVPKTTMNDSEAWEKYKESEHEREEVYTKLAEPEVKQHYLVKYKSDWADEMYIYGLDLLTDVDKEWFESLNPTDDKPFVHHVGTNEDIEYTSASSFQEAYTWTPITVEEREILKKLIGTDYGHFFYPELDEEEENEDDTEEEEW